MIRVPVAEQVIGLLKSDLPTSGSLGDNNLPGNTPTVWAFWDWLCRTVMSPLAVLAVQPSLFPYFHVRNNEIYSLCEHVLANFGLESFGSNVAINSLTIFASRPWIHFVHKKTTSKHCNIMIQTLYLMSTRSTGGQSFFIIS